MHFLFLPKTKEKCLFLDLKSLGDAELSVRCGAERDSVLWYV